MGNYRRHGRDCVCAYQEMIKSRNAAVIVDTCRANGSCDFRREINRRLAHVSLIRFFFLGG